MNLKRLRLADTITGIAGILLIIALFAVPWHVDIAGEDKSAVQSPNGYIGLLILLLTSFVVALVVLERLLDASPELPREYHQIILYLALADTFLVLVKLYQKSDELGWGVWMVVLLTAVMLWGAVLTYRAAGDEEVFEDWS